jgi:hypothetical protein
VKKAAGVVEGRKGSLDEWFIYIDRRVKEIAELNDRLNTYKETITGKDMEIKRLKERLRRFT